jgi:hypothetical protein
MKTALGRRFHRFCLMAAVGGLAILLGAANSAAQTPTGVARVEEDWQLVIDQPDINNDGPQVTCVISPQTVDAVYAAFDINFHSQPDYTPGGLQMHVWDPIDPIQTCEFPVSGVMQQVNETVSWTQTMTLFNNVLLFQVVNGASQTWGSFGGSGSWLAVQTSLTDLDAYDSSESLDNSGVSYAGNRVQSLTLVAVRWYDSQGHLIQQNTTPQTVHPQ